MDKKDLKKVKEKLLERKRELLRSIQVNLDSSNQSSNNRSSDPIDLASDSFEDDLSMSLAGREAEPQDVDKDRAGLSGQLASLARSHGVLQQALEDPRQEGLAANRSPMGVRLPSRHRDGFLFW